MNKARYAKAVLALIILSGLLCTLAPSQAAQPKLGLPPGVGRENPFEDIPKPKKTVLQRVFNVSEPAEVPELFVESVTLRFLDAVNLKEAIQNMSSEYGYMAANPGNNSLIICDTKENLAKILSEISKADKKPRQVMIEVVIVDVLLGDDTEIGINWDLLSDKNYDISYRQNLTTSRLRSTVEDTDTIGDATAFVTRGLGGDFSVISGTVRNLVHLLQQKRDAEILASPRVMLVSGATASIEAVEELPYTEVLDTAAGGAAAITSTKFKLVGVRLNVSATLTDTNDILLSVEAVQNVATGQSNTEIPIVDTRKAKTSLLLEDGQIVILGGLRRQEKTKEVDQIPILGDIPLLGLLFKSTSTVVKNSELIVFLAPHVYKGEPIPDEAMEKYKEITDRPILSLPEADESEDHADLEQRIDEQAEATLQLHQEIADLKLAEDEWGRQRQQLEQHLDKQAGANEQLEQEIAERKAAEGEWSKYRHELEQRVQDHASANEHLQLELDELIMIQDQWEQDRWELEWVLGEQIAANKKLEKELCEHKLAQGESRKYDADPDQRLKTPIVINKQPLQKIVERGQVQDEWKEHPQKHEHAPNGKDSGADQPQQEISDLRVYERDVTKRLLLEKMRLLRNRRREKGVADELMATIAELQKIISQEIGECLEATERAQTGSGT
jgi:hypothetical protein